MRTGDQSTIRFSKAVFWFDAFLVVGGLVLGILLLSVAGVLEPGPVSNGILLLLVLVMGAFLVGLTFARKKKQAGSLDEDQQTSLGR